MAALHPKMTAGSLAGALSLVLVTELNRRGITISPEEASSITVILSGLASYFMPGDDNGGGTGGVADTPQPAAVVPLAPPAIVAPLPAVPAPAPAAPVVAPVAPGGNP